MTFGTSIFLIAVGAILKFAVHAHISGVSVATIGVILMVAGAVGLLLSMFFYARATDRRHTARTTIVRDRSPDPYA